MEKNDITAIEVEKPRVILILDKIFLFIFAALFIYAGISSLFIKGLIDLLGFGIALEIAIGILFIFLAIREKQKVIVKTKYVEAVKGINFAFKSYVLYMAIVFFFGGIYLSFSLKKYFFLIITAIGIFLFWIWNLTKYKYRIIKQ
jgi:glucose uptake protein GlcU